MNKKELNETINRFFAANEEKKVIESEVKDLRADILDYMGDKELDTYTTPEGYTAAISYRNGKKLNLDKVAALLGGVIPDDCYEATQTPVFTVKAAKAAAVKMAVVRAVSPTTAVVAA